MRNGDYQFRSEYFQNLAQKAIKELAAKAAKEQALELAKDMAKDMAKEMAKDIAKGMAKEMAKDIASELVKQRLAQRAREDLAAAEAEGFCRGRIECILILLEARGMCVSAAQDATIRACRDDTQLRAWFIRAITAESVDAVLAAPEPQG